MENDLKNKIITKYYPKCNDIFRLNLTRMLTEYENLPVNPKYQEKEMETILSK